MNINDYRSILAIAARYTDRLPLALRISLAVRDYDDRPDAPVYHTSLTLATLDFFRRI